MQRGKFTGIFEKRRVAEKVARLIYMASGYVVPDDAPEMYMHQSQHPQEQSCVAIAYEVIKVFMRG
jgi:hypothetical protein